MKRCRTSLGILMLVATTGSPPVRANDECDDVSSLSLPVLNTPFWQRWRPAQPSVAAPQNITERDLMLAILEEALNDYQRCFGARDKKGRNRFTDARAWIVNTDSEWIFSFINCCEVLGIEPDYLRQGLLRWKQGKRARLLSAPAIQHQKHQPQRLRQAA
jgi:hypothetical protein